MTSKGMKTNRLPPMPEAALQDAVIQLLHLCGFKVAHFRPGMTSREDKQGNPVWVTPVQADGEGYPDLDAVKAPRQLVIELKADGKYPEPKQRAWLDTKAACPGNEVYVWRPKDYRDGTIERIIQNGPRPGDQWPERR